MNERIRELAVQARQYAWENETHWSADAERATLFEQKFAELIVRECAGIVNSLEQYEGQGDCSTAEYIKGRFGVAE